MSRLKGQIFKAIKILINYVDIEYNLLKLNVLTFMTISVKLLMC